jgi:hypothetical protein
MVFVATSHVRRRKSSAGEGAGGNRRGDEVQSLLCESRSLHCVGEVGKEQEHWGVMQHRRAARRA